MVVRSAIPAGRVLGLDVNVGVAGVAGLADPGDRLAFGHLLTDVDGDAALAEVAHHQVVAAANVDH